MGAIRFTPDCDHRSRAGETHSFSAVPLMRDDLHTDQERREHFTPGPAPGAVPQSRASERAILGLIFIDNANVSACTGLTPEHFADPVHAQAFIAVQSMIAQGRPANARTIAALFATHDLPADYLLQIEADAPPGDADAYFADLETYRARRAAIAIADALRDAANSIHVSLDETIEKLTAALKECARPASKSLLDGRVLTPSEWDGQPVPERTWLVRDLLPTGVPTIISGDGAAGKSLLMLQLAVARAVQHPWIGVECQPGRTLILSAEDDKDEMHRRLAKVCAGEGVSLADLGDRVKIINLVGADSVLGALNKLTGRIEPTALFAEVSDLIESFQPDHVVVDTLADAYVGNEIDRSQVRQFVSLLRQWCVDHRTVTIIAHPSQSGMESGTGTSGSTAWNNSVRSRLYLETDKDDPDIRKLTTKKLNAGKRGAEIMLRWVDWYFEPKAGPGMLDRMARAALADRIFLDLLRLFTRTGQALSPSRSKTYAPSLFAEHHGASGVTSKEFADAMQRHLEAGRIRIDETGPPSKRRPLLVACGG